MPSRMVRFLSLLTREDLDKESFVNLIINLKIKRMEENKNEEITKSMEVLKEINGFLYKVEEILDKNVDGMDASIAALAGIAIHGFTASACKTIERRLEKDALFKQVKAKHIADAENSGLSMN